MTDRSGVDPRFDPAFQPGYQGPLSAQPSSPVGRSPAPRDEPVPNPPARELPPERHPIVQPIRDDVKDDSEVEEDRPRRNPFLIALWVMGGVLTVVPLWLAWQSYQAQVDPQGIGSQDSWLLFAFMMQLAPPILFVGLGALAGALALSAARWRR